MEEADLHQILGEDPGARLVAVALGDVPEERDGLHVHKVEVEHLEDAALGAEDVGLLDVLEEQGPDVALYGRGDDLLVLGADVQARHPEQLDLGDVDELLGQEPVDQVDAHEEGLGAEAELVVDLDDVIDERLPLLRVYLRLVAQIVSVGEIIFFAEVQVVEHGLLVAELHHRGPEVLHLDLVEQVHVLGRHFGAPVPVNLLLRANFRALRNRL